METPEARGHLEQYRKSLGWPKPKLNFSGNSTERSRDHVRKRSIFAIILVDEDGDHATTVEEIQLDSEETAVISPLIHLFKTLRADHQSDAQIEGKP